MTWTNRGMEGCTVEGTKCGGRGSHFTNSVAHPTNNARRDSEYTNIPSHTHTLAHGFTAPLRWGKCNTRCSAKACHKARPAQRFTTVCRRSPLPYLRLLRRAARPIRTKGGTRPQATRTPLLGEALPPLPSGGPRRPLPSRRRVTHCWRRTQTRAMAGAGPCAQWGGPRDRCR